MKKYIFTLFMGYAALQFTHACDVCGGAVTSPGGDALPGIFSNYIGWRSSLRTFNTSHIPLFNEVPWESRERIWSTELNGRYSPIRRLQFLGSLPFQYISKLEMSELNVISGLGDAMLRANLLVIDKDNKSDDKITNLFVGSALKLPTGKSQATSEELAIFNRNMLPSTGTVDVGFHADFVHRSKKWGVMSNQVLFFRGGGDHLYAFGNMYQGSLSSFYYEKKEKMAYIAEFGGTVLYTKSDIDLKFNTMNPYTGGLLIAPFIRINAFVGDFIFSSSLQVPAYQNLAKGYVTNRFTSSVSIIYQFNSKKNA